MPAPVASRRRLTSAAVKSAMSVPLVRSAGIGRGDAPPSPGRGGAAPARSARLRALGAGLGSSRGGRARGRGDLVRGDRRRLGRGLGQIGRGSTARVGTAGQKLALP